MFKFLDFKEEKFKDLIESSKFINKNVIEFRNVNFSYKDTKILNNINLKLEKNNVIGIVGESGSGKSTLLKILMSFYDADSGEIFIDGKEIKTYNLTELRNKIAYVPQDSYLFYGTVKENISYGLGEIETTEEFIIDAAKKASAHDFIMKLPNGYDTMIQEKSTNLSGGEKQIIAIARAFLKNAPILLLDEPTSALDKQSEEIVKKSIMKLMENRTVLIVTHKISTIENADYIYKIDKENIFSFDQTFFQRCTKIKNRGVKFMSQELEKLINEYKETARCMKMSMDWLNDKDYAIGKLDLVKTVIADLEKLSGEAK